ncbi:hypothetical protein RhiirA4_462939 [Rhizophagus irregularis]|uniref:Uncharacterized protein n=1 Tax=Rhizophagus irregularis TaxID=588596 RepID=A0A2I1GM21_9GLOM|nr:hypothetical protein RhiirA4_462939 [Rhizophagus irregularis]
MRKQIKELQINDNDEDEAHNNPNLHSEEQDELELPDSLVKNPSNSLSKEILSSLANSVRDECTGNGDGKS